MTKPKLQRQATAPRFPWSPPLPSSRAAVASVFLFALLVRAMVGLGPYSGQASPPRYGDYEAQRHWMEVTLHLPPIQWYRDSPANPLAYWGLDYPPLSAYQSRVHALFLNATIPDAVALTTSRGFESHSSKLLMRWTVLSSDLMIFFPAALWFVSVFAHDGVDGRSKVDGSMLWLLAIILISPCLILTDHGHFQYNCISLGLTLGAIAAILSKHELLGSVFFTLAMNHKQMCLYYAPAFFSHLLGKSLKRKYPILEVIKLGFIVLATFALVWWPFFHSLDTTIEVLTRLAPFERGIFEDYVANFWCTTSVIIKWKRLFTMQCLKLMSLAATVLAFLPSFIQQIKNPSNIGFLYSLVNSSFAFYLFSYQVHEKSILLPLLPASLLASCEPLHFIWFTYNALFSMFPLLCRDQLVLQYIGVLGLFILIFYSPGIRVSMDLSILHKRKAVIALPLLTSLALQIIYLCLEPPERYPFLFEALMMFLSFSQFVFLTLYTNYKQWIVCKPVSGKKDL